MLAAGFVAAFTLTALASRERPLTGASTVAVEQAVARPPVAMQLRSVAALPALRGPRRTAAVRKRPTRAAPASVRGSRGRHFDVAPVDDRSLVPRALRRLVRDLGERPRATGLAGYRAWRYSGLLGRNGSDVLDVTVLPSSAGTLGVGCISPLGAASATADCASSIRSVSMRNAAIFVPSPDLALSLTLPDVLTALDRARVRGRAALRGAGTRGGQARFALRLVANVHFQDRRWARRSASVRMPSSERATVRSQDGATTAPHHAPSAHRSVPSSPRYSNAVPSPLARSS